MDFQTKVGLHHHDAVCADGCLPFVVADAKKRLPLHLPPFVEVGAPEAVQQVLEEVEGAKDSIALCRVTHTFQHNRALKLFGLLDL